MNAASSVMKSRRSVIDHRSAVAFPLFPGTLFLQATRIGVRGHAKGSDPNSFLLKNSRATFLIFGGLPERDPSA